ncbi:YfhO family protein [soil metagenome]
MGMGKDRTRKTKERGATRRKIRQGGPALGERNVFDQLPGWAQHACCIGFLLLVTLAFFHPIVFGGQALVGGDTVQWRGSAQAMLEYEERTGGEALWSPNMFSGMPGYHIHYPPQAFQIDDVLRTVRGWGAWPWAHFFALLLGVYFLSTFLTRMKLPSTLAAVAFGLSTYLPIILVAGHNTKFVALAMAPWLLLAFAFIVNQPDGGGWRRSVIAMLLFAIALTVNLRAMHVQITYYLLFAVGIWWMAVGYEMIRGQRGLAFARATGLLVLGAAVALLMVAQPYFAHWEYKLFTTRGAGESGGLAWDYAMRWSQGLGEMFTLLVPGAYGGDGATYWGAKPFTAGPHYVGPIVLGLAGLALFGVGRRAVIAIGISIGLMMLFALGEYLPLVNRPMFEFFPLFSAFRVPETWLSIVALLLALLAGFGAYYLARREPTPELDARKKRAALWMYGIVAATTLLVWFGGLAGVFAFERPGEAEQITQMIAAQAGVDISDPRVGQAARGFLADARTERREMLTGDALRSLLFALAVLGLLYAYRVGRVSALPVLVVLILLVTIDLWGVGRRYFHPDISELRSRDRAVTAAIPQYDFDRYILQRVEEAGGSGTFRTLPLALNPMNSARESFFYESTSGYHGAKLSLYQDYIDNLLFWEGRLNPNALELMSTRFIISERPVPGYQEVYRDQATGLSVFENSAVLPRAILVDEAEIIEDQEAVFSRLRDPAFNLHKTVILHEDPGLGWLHRGATIDTTIVPEEIDDGIPLVVETDTTDSSIRQDTIAGAPQADVAGPSDIDSIEDARPLSAGVSLVRYTPNEAIYLVQTDRSRLLLLSEVYFPAGWEASINNAEVPILRANHLMRAIPVSAGQHLVTVRFHPAVHDMSVTISRISSFIVYLLLVVLLGVHWYRREQKV